MSYAQLDKHLDLMEQQLRAAQQALLCGDSSALEKNCAQLQQYTVALAQALPALDAAAWKTGPRARRIQVLGQTIPQLRAGLMRCNAYVEQALKTVVPTAAPSTYAGSRTVYGSALRQSGTIRGMAA